MESWRGGKMSEVEIIVGGNRSLLPSLRSITKFTLFQFYKSENLYYKLQVQVQVQFTSGEE